MGKFGGISKLDIRTDLLQSGKESLGAVDHEFIFGIENREGFAADLLVGA